MKQNTEIFIYESILELKTDTDVIKQLNPFFAIVIVRRTRINGITREKKRASLDT